MITSRFLIIVQVVLLFVLFPLIFSCSKKPDDKKHVVNDVVNIVKKYGQAINLFNQSIKLNPKNEVVHLYLGVIYGIIGKYDLAILQYEEAIKLKSDYADAYLRLGWSYYLTDNKDLAMQQYEKAIKLNPNLENAHYSLGLAYFEKGQYDLAIKYAEKALVIKPEYSEARELLDNLYQLSGLSGLSSNKPVNERVYHLQNSKVFHRLNCNIIKDKSNLGSFKSSPAAKRAGGKPCEICRP